MSLPNVDRVLSTTIQFGQQIEKSFSDGFQPLADIISLIPVLTQIPELIKDKELIIAELTPFDEPKATEIHAYVNANLVLTNKKIESVVKGAFGVGLAIFSLYLVLKPTPVVTPPVV